MDGVTELFISTPQNDFVRKNNNNDNERLQNDAALFRNKRFALNKMFQRNASKFAIFYV